jgi:proteasome lid subunit RPN8/RPN11
MSAGPQLGFSPRIMDRMLAFGWNSYPAEAVGLLAGVRDGLVRSVHGLQNVAPLGRFFADPYQQFQAERRIQTARQKILASFHTHPEGIAALSEIDCRYVFEVAPVAVIVALKIDRRRAEVKAFRRDAANTVVPVKIAIL